MEKSFEEALYDLVGEYSRKGTSADDLISAMELSIMAIEEQEEE